MVPNIQGIPHYTHIECDALKHASCIPMALGWEFGRHCGDGADRRAQFPPPAHLRQFATMATLKQSLIFLLKWTLVGLAAACVLLLARPTLFGRPATGPGSEISLPAAQSAASSEPRRSFADAVARAAPAVVNIYTARVVSTEVRPAPSRPLFEQNLPAVRRRVESSLGSGVIVDGGGRAHV